MAPWHLVRRLLHFSRCLKKCSWLSRLSIRKRSDLEVTFFILQHHDIHCKFPRKFLVHYSKNPHTRTCGLRTRTLKFGNKGTYIYMSGFMKTVWKNESCALSRRFFFSPETISKVDDIKIKSKVSAFFPPLHVHLPFVTLLSLLFARF